MIAIGTGEMATVGRVGATIAVGLGRLPVPMPGAVVAAVARVGNEADLLDFLIDRVLEKLIEFLALGFDLGDVGEFDFDGSREAVAAVFGQTEFLAVVGAEFDGHDVVFMFWVVGVNTKKPIHPEGRMGFPCEMVECSYAAFAVTGT